MHWEGWIMKRKLMVPIVCALCAVLVLSCTVQAGRSIRGSGHVTEETHKLRGITGVELASFGNLYIKKGSREQLRVEAEENLHEYFEIEVEGKRLVIDTRRLANLRPKKPVNFYLTVKRLDTIKLSGCGDIEAPDMEGRRITLTISGAGDIETGDLEADEIMLKVSGAGDLIVDGAEAEELRVTISGAGDVEIGDVDVEMAELEITGAGNASISHGRIDRQDIVISGTGDYCAKRVESRDADVVVSGCGSATIQVHDNLEAMVSGTGDVRYVGRPRVRASVSGAGDLERI
jgi:hypothetical protein